jgi:chemotaxis protein MotB
MARRPKKQQGGVPEWVVTFGDMMSLLLCFFVLLHIFSEPKKDHQYQRVIVAIKEAFGFSGGVGVLPIDDPPVRSIVERLEEMALRKHTKASSESSTESIQGEHVRVRKLREGLVFTIGGPTTFDEGSAELEPGSLRELEKLAVVLAGRRNKITVRGHAAAKYLPAGSRWRDLDELSYNRSRAVREALVGLGLDDAVFRLEAVGAREPINPRALDAAAAAENRRVEVILTEELVEEAMTDANFTDPGLARGGTSDG